MIAQLVVAALGIWMMVAPALLGMPQAASNVVRVLGPIVAALGVCASAEHLRAMRLWNIPLAVALFAAPGFVSFGGTLATANALATAALILSLSLRRGAIAHRYGGGWRAVFSGDGEASRS